MKFCVICRKNISDYVRNHVLNNAYRIFFFSLGILGIDPKSWVMNDPKAFDFSEKGNRTW